jgi:hypothetical protein
MFNLRFKNQLLTNIDPVGRFDLVPLSQSFILNAITIGNSIEGLPPLHSMFALHGATPLARLIRKYDLTTTRKGNQ